MPFACSPMPTCVVLSDIDTKFAYIKISQTTAKQYYKWKIFSMSVLTLNFDLYLGKVSSEIWRRR